jgi:mono/diheme cytochrome c family protein
MNVKSVSGILLAVVLSAILCVLEPMGGLPLKGQAASPQADSGKAATKDDYQRSYEIFTYSTTAKSGPQRGEELYFIKCWFCHNQFAKTGPQLGELYKRGTFTMTGEPVNDQAVTEKIRTGGPLMPSYGTTLKDADIADLVSYIKSGKCCFDSENPPPNPRYRYHGGSR